MTAISDELIQRLREICRGGQGTYAIRRDAGQAADALQQARARIGEQREWMRRAGHQSPCPYSRAYYPHETCTCGLDAALAASGET